MEAIVTYDSSVEIKKEDGSVSYHNMNGLRVKVISVEGNSYKCMPIGFPWEGTFDINKKYLKIVPSSP